MTRKPPAEEPTTTGGPNPNHMEVDVTTVLGTTDNGSNGSQPKPLRRFSGFRAQAARARDLDRSGEKGATLLIRADLYMADRCVYCGSPLRSEASKKRAAGKLCAAANRGR